MVLANVQEAARFFVQPCTHWKKYIVKNFQFWEGKSYTESYTESANRRKFSAKKSEIFEKNLKVSKFSQFFSQQFTIRMHSFIFETFQLRPWTETKSMHFFCFLLSQIFVVLYFCYSFSHEVLHNNLGWMEKDSGKMWFSLMKLVCVWTVTVL